MFTKFFEFEWTVISESLSASKIDDDLHFFTGRSLQYNEYAVALDEQNCQQMEEAQVLAQRLTFYLKTYPTHQFFEATHVCCKR